jgi:hypothetical protein
MLTTLYENGRFENAIVHFYLLLNDRFAVVATARPGRNVNAELGCQDRSCRRRAGIFYVPKFGGGSGIRTHGGIAATPVFKTGALNRSAIPPASEIDRLPDCRPNLAIRRCKNCHHRLARAFAFSPLERSAAQCQRSLPRLCRPGRNCAWMFRKSGARSWNGLARGRFCPFAGVRNAIQSSAPYLFLPRQGRHGGGQG